MLAGLPFALPEIGVPWPDNSVSLARGGKFFRFHPDAAAIDSNPSVTESTGNVHGASHFWLCERCSHVFTLVYDAEHEVVLTLHWLELPLTEALKELPASRVN